MVGKNVWLLFSLLPSYIYKDGILLLVYSITILLKVPNKESSPRLVVKILLKEILKFYEWIKKDLIQKEILEAV